MNPLPEQSVALTRELVDHFTLGAIAAGAGISGGAEFQQSTAELAATVASELGLGEAWIAGLALDDGADYLAGLTPETGGLATGLAELAGKAWVKLSGGASKVAAFAVAHPGIIGAGAGLYIAHDYLSGPTQTAVERERQTGQTMRSAVAKLSPAELAKRLKDLQGGTDSALPWIIAGIAIAAGVALYFYTRPKPRR